jgi:hypothetical protein
VKGDDGGDDVDRAEHNMWMLVDLPPGHHAIGLKGVFKLKHDE